MSPLDVATLAAGALGRNRKRTALSLLGISIGIAAVLVLTGLGEGARQYLRAQFDFIGSDVVGIVPGKAETTGGIPGVGRVPNDLTLADAAALVQLVPGVQRAAPIVMGTETASCEERSRQLLVMGTTSEDVAIRKLELHLGSFLPEAPWERSSRVAVLGRKAASELLPGQNPLGAIIRVGGWRMRVIGVLATQGVHFGIDLDDTVFVPVATAMRMFDRSSLFRIALQVRPGFDIESIQARCSKVLAQRHGEEDFTITTPDAVLSSLESILNILTLALVAIASISLGVAGIGIMNVMLVSVSERTQEVGLVRAIGAEPRQVLSVFLAEAAMLSAMGGVLGLAVGYGLIALASILVPSFPFQAPAWAAGLAFAMSVTVGVVFGIWPAMRAVRLDPVVALSGRAE